MRKMMIYGFLAPLAIIPSIILNGFVLKVLWGWFLSPWLTPTVPSVTLCLGITTIFGLLAKPHHFEKKYSGKNKPAGKPFDVEKLPIDEETRKQIKALQELANMNAGYAFRGMLIGMIFHPLGALAFGWVLKFFL